MNEREQEVLKRLEQAQLGTLELMVLKHGDVLQGVRTPSELGLWLRQNESSVGDGGIIENVVFDILDEATLQIALIMTGFPDVDFTTLPGVELGSYNG